MTSRLATDEEVDTWRDEGWVLLDSINQAFTEPVVTAAPGGAGGGGAILTAFGAEVLERYRRILDRAVTNAVDDLAALARKARLEAGPKV